VFAPMLRMDALTRELLHAGEGRQIAGVVVVVAGAADEEAAGVAASLAGRLVQRGDRPAALERRPVSADDLEAVVDLLVDAVLGRGVRDVLADRRRISEHLVVLPPPG